jgi:hypothetical protein
MPNRFIRRSTPLREFGDEESAATATAREFSAKRPAPPEPEPDDETLEMRLLRFEAQYRD